jgi:uncharacterized protein with HEPN domain
VRDDLSRLQDIFNSIKLIEATLPNGRLVYDLSEIEFQGILRCLEIIGEASKAISVDHEKIELVVHGSLEDLKRTVVKLLG